MPPAAPSLDVYKDQDFYVPAFRIFLDGREQIMEANDVMSVTYKDSLEAIDSFEMTVNNWDAEKLTFKYSDGDTFNPGKDAQLFMGYIRNGQSGLRRMLTGEITTLGPNFPASGGPTLSVSGLNLLHRFRLKQEPRQFLQKKDTEVAQALIEKIAEEIRKSSPRLSVELDPEDVATNLKKEQPIPYLVVQNEYPILHLMERARRIGYELSAEEVEDNGDQKVTIHFRPTSYVSRPTYILEWGKTLISFQPTLGTARQVDKVNVRGWNAQAKKPFLATATRADLGEEKIVNPSDLAVSGANRPKPEEIVVDQPVQTQPEANELAKKMLRQIAQGLVEAQAKTVGLPELRAGVKVEIRGVGTRFSGTYLVTSSTHSIGDGGYTTDFKARMEKP
jgi:uncharacterized protein